MSGGGGAGHNLSCSFCIFNYFPKDCHDKFYGELQRIPRGPQDPFRESAISFLFHLKICIKSAQNRLNAEADKKIYLLIQTVMSRKNQNNPTFSVFCFEKYIFHKHMLFTLKNYYWFLLLLFIM